MRFYIDNKIAFWAAVLAFLGSLFVTLDRFSYFQERFSDVGRWKRIASGLKQLDEMNGKNSDGTPLGLLRPNDEGFVELAKIISLNRQDLAKKQIVVIAKNKPVAIARLSIPVIHVATVDSPLQATPVAFEFGLMQRISAYRTEWFLYRGFILVSVGFLLGVISRIKRKKKEESPNKEPAPMLSAVTSVADAPVVPMAEEKRGEGIMDESS